jgi:hypothetical protein
MPQRGLVVLLCRLVSYTSIRSAKDGVTTQRLLVGELVEMVGTLNVLRTFYSDWLILGVMTDDIAGLPSGDREAIYWLYWTSERLPMLSL